MFYELRNAWCLIRDGYLTYLAEEKMDRARSVPFLSMGSSRCPVSVCRSGQTTAFLTGLHMLKVMRWHGTTRSDHGNQPSIALLLCGTDYCFFRWKFKWKKWLKWKKKIYLMFFLVFPASKSEHNKVVVFLEKYLATFSA